MLIVYVKSFLKKANRWHFKQFQQKVLQTIKRWKKRSLNFLYTYVVMIILKIKRQSLFQILWKDLMQKLSEADVTYLWTSVSVHRVYSVIC